MIVVRGHRLCHAAWWRFGGSSGAGIRGHQALKTVMIMN